jgi:hypothetical protein
MLFHTRRNGDVVMKEAARGVVRRIIAETPPARPGKTGKAAHNAGKKTVAAQIGKIMVGVPANQAQHTNIRELHKAARVEGRIKGPKKENRYKVPIRALRAFIKAAQARVGQLAAGWKKAAQKLRVNVPAWIAKHNADGDGEVKTTPQGIKIILRNSVGYASGLRNMKRRIARALRGQEKAMANRLRNMVEQAAQSSGVSN